MEEENRKFISMTKKGFWWYTLLSFLLVTLLIFTAVMLTHTAAVRSVGSTFAEQIVLARDGLTRGEVQNLSAVQTYHDGDNVFAVSYEKDGTKHLCYVGAEDGCPKGCPSAPETSLSPDGTNAGGILQERSRSLLPKEERVNR